MKTFSRTVEGMEQCGEFRGVRILKKSSENQLNDLQKPIDYWSYAHLVVKVSLIAIFLSFKFYVVYSVIAVLLLAFITAVCSNEVSSLSQFFHENVSHKE